MRSLTPLRKLKNRRYGAHSRPMELLEEEPVMNDLRVPDPAPKPRRPNWETGAKSAVPLSRVGRRQVRGYRGVAD
jgi:hypothetical protein